MRYPLTQADRCVGRLRPGEYKRVPLRGPIIGIYLACPACGYRCLTILSDEHGVSEAAGRLTSVKPVRCLICDEPAKIIDGEMVIDGV